MTLFVRPFLRVVAFATMCLIATFSQAQTQASCSFNYFKLNPANGVDPETHPLGINSFSSVVGQAVSGVSSSVPAKGFTRFSNGAVSYFSPAGSISAELAGRNDNGASIGDYSTRAPLRTSFLLQGSNMTTIAHPNADLALGGTLVRGINKYISIVGYYFDSHEFPHGFKRFSNGAFSTIAFPNATGTMPNAINSSGWIVGSYTDPSGGLHGFVYKNGAYATVDYPNTTATELFGISDAGAVIGLDHSIEQGRAFLYNKGVFKVISAPNSFYTHATGIAPTGLIIGKVVYNGQLSTVQGFIATCQ